MTLLISVLEQGLIYAIMALGMYITYKILDFPDLTVDGSFPMGAAISASMISLGIPSAISLVVAFIAGVIAGTITGLIHIKLRVRDILASIIMMTALYSINLRIAGKANLPIYNFSNIFSNSFTDKIFVGVLAPYKTVIVALVIVIVIKLLLDLYLKTKSGYLLKAVGDNETLVTSLGVDKGKVKILGLAIANGLVALSGAMLAQQQRFFDVSMGVGTAVIGLASVIIGSTLLGKSGRLGFTISVIIGAIFYRACVAAAIRLGLPSGDLKLVTAALFLLILIISSLLENRRKGRA